jgi:O-antigen/teichoic acid export membrane protein
MAFSVWISLSQLVNTLNWKSDQLFIGYFLGSAALGYYTVGDNLAVLPTRESTTPLAQTLFPGFRRLTQDPIRLREAYQHAQSFTSAVALPLGCGFATIAKPLVLLALGPNWLPSVVVIQLLASIYALQTLSNALEPLALAMGKTRSLFQRDVFNFAVRLPLITIGLITGGLVGVLCARCVSGLIAMTVNMEIARRLIGLSLRDQFVVNLRPLISVSMMVFGASIVRVAIGDGDGQLGLVIKIAVLVATGAAIYIVTLFALWHRMGHPAGPETDVVKLMDPMFGRISDRFRRRASRSSKTSPQG